MRKIILIILTVFFFSEISAQVTLKNDTIVKKYFDKSEITELLKLVSFFDKSVLKDCESKEILDSCYVKYYSAIYEKAISTGDIDFNIDNNELHEIVENLSESTFNKIWSYHDFINKETGEHIQVLNILVRNDYMKLVNEMSKVDTTFQDYYDSVRSAGDISPSLISGVLYFCRKFDYKIERVRLFLAIHYSTILYRKELD